MTVNVHVHNVLITNLIKNLILSKKILKNEKDD